ncbi:MAG: M23 family metallopeptidase [Bacteroidales bacterium]|nr:M23 family metallopeptidase [Bacteroidales bacterium]
MSKSSNKEQKTTFFRLAIIDDKTHKQLFTVHFTRISAFIAIFSTLFVICTCVFLIIAYTPAKTFIPGYPDARSQRAAIQNVLKADSLASVIYRWELYSENLKRVIDGQEPIKIDSLINSIRNTSRTKGEAANLLKQDSLLRDQVKEEEQFDISARERRNLPIEGMLFFTPVKGVISQKYDPVIHPYIDITAPAGSVVKAVLDGTVIYSGWSEDAGHTIQIQHDGDIISIYKHNQKLLKQTGDKVTAGSPIAIVGNTGGLSTGEHLHFELWHKGESLDPAKYINF